MNEKAKNESNFSSSVPGWHHLIIDGEEEINLAKFAKYLNSEGKLDMAAIPQRQSAGGAGTTDRNY